MPSRPARNRAKISPQFYFDRGNARAQLGRLADSLADANKAIEVGRGAASPLMMGRLIALAAQQYSAAGDPKKAFELYQRQLREVASQKGAKGYQFGANRAIAGILIQMGDIAQAEAYLRRSQPQIQEARTSGHPGKRAAYNVYGQSWEAEIELGRAMLFETRGQFREAEASFKLGELRRRAAIKGLLGSENPPSESSLVLSVDFTVLSQARMKARQGRFAEAEVDARRALLSQLKNQGKYSPVTPRFIGDWPTFWSSRAVTPKPSNWPGCRSRSAGPSASPRTRSRTCSSCRSSAAS